MFVTHSFQIPHDKNLYNELRIMQREAASVWNDIVREATSYYFACKKWLSKTEIQVIRKQTYNLHSQTVQAIADKYVSNRETIRQLRKTDKKAKYPWRRKYYYCIPLKKASMDVSKETITIKKSEYGFQLSDLLKKNWNEKFPKKNKSVVIPNLSEETLDMCNYAEVVWRNGAYWFCYSIQVPEKNISSYDFKVAGGDLGEIHQYGLFTRKFTIRTSTVLVEKSCFDKAGLFNERFWYSQDWDMWLRLAAFYKGACLKEPLTEYWLHGENRSSHCNRVNHPEIREFSGSYIILSSTCLESNEHFKRTNCNKITYILRRSQVCLAVCRIVFISFLSVLSV